MTGKEYNNQFSEEELATEIWKDIPEWEGLYQVSNLGRVKSLEHRVMGYKRKVTRISYERILSPAIRKRDGYVVVSFSKDKKTKMYVIQRLVLLAFVGPCPEGMEACHGPDYSPINCRLSNLRWDTDKANQMDRIYNNTDNRGEKNGQCKITKQQVLEIRNYPDITTNRRAQEKMAKKHGISKTSVYDIISKRTWAWL